MLSPICFTDHVFLLASFLLSAALTLWMYLPHPVHSLDSLQLPYPHSLNHQTTFSPNFYNPSNSLRCDYVLPSLSIVLFTIYSLWWTSHILFSHHFSIIVSFLEAFSSLSRACASSMVPLAFNYSFLWFHPRLPPSARAYDAMINGFKCI